MILCIWVHGYKQGVGNHQKKGMGKALLAAAEEDIRQRGAKGVAAWGIGLPVWMKASWFKKQGYKVADKMGGFPSQVLLWKPFTDDARPPLWIKEKKKPQPVAGKVTVSGFISGWCPAMNMVYERARRAAEELDGRVDFRQIDTFNRDALKEWGIADAVFLDDKKLGSGPPPSYEKIKKKIAKKIKKLGTPPAQ